MSLKEAKDSSTLELMHASTGFWTEVLSMARRVINVIRSCALAYLLTIAVSWLMVRRQDCSLERLNSTHQRH
jgi:hypothetical protein